MPDIDVILSSGISWYRALLLGFGVIILSWYAYPPRVRQVSAGRWRFPLLLRILAGSALFLLLVRPELDIIRQRSDPTTLLVLLDRSSSMSIRDTDDTPNRLRAALLVLEDAERIMDRTTSVSTTILPFADSVSTPVSGEDILALEPVGFETNIAAALRSANGIRPPVRRIYLITDGNDTTGLDPIEAAAALSAPIDVIPVGRERSTGAPPRDIAIDSIDRSDSVPLGSVIPITVHISGTGYAGRVVNIILRSKDDTIAEGEIMVDDLPGTQSLTLNFHPDRTGIYDLSISVSPLPGETVAENNTVNFPLSVHDKLPRVLYIDGAIRPEYKFLRRVLSTDPGIEFMSLVRLEEDRFLRQGSVHGVLLENIPRTETELSSFDTLILGDIPARAIGEQSLALIEDSVSNGMGLMILCTPSTTGDKCEYGTTPTWKAFPAIPRKTSYLEQTLDSFKLTKDGQRHPVTEGLSDLFNPKTVLPPLPGYDPVERIRSTSTVIISASDNDESDVPILITGRYGKGRTAIFLGHEAWRWQLRPTSQNTHNVYSRLWGQTVRWLSGTDSNREGNAGQFSVSASQLVVQAGESVTLSARTRGLTAADPVSVVAHVTSNAGRKESIGFSPLPGMNDVFEAGFNRDTPGRYQLNVAAVTGNSVIATQDLTIRVRGGRGEFERLSPNLRLLSRIASETGGAVHQLQDLPDALMQEAQRIRSMQRAQRIPLWHSEALFLAFCAFLSAEWLLRKRAGLP